MELYFSPMACSLASRISLYEAGAKDVQFVEVDSKTKRTVAGANYFEIYALGLVPFLRLEDGSGLSENAAILQYIASRHPGSELAPRDEKERAQLQQWLCFIGTELHKGMFIPLFDQKAPEGTQDHTLNKYASRLKYLNGHLTGRQYLLDRFTVADAYLYTILNWTMPTQVDLAPYPAIKSYHASLQNRPSIAKAFGEEMALYKAELARNKAAWNIRKVGIGFPKNLALGLKPEGPCLTQDPKRDDDSTWNHCALGVHSQTRSSPLRPESRYRFGHDLVGLAPVIDIGMETGGSGRSMACCVIADQADTGWFSIRNTR